MNKINLTEQSTKFKAEEILVGDMVVVKELEHNEIFEVWILLQHI